METHNPESDPVEASRIFDERLRKSPAYIGMNASLRRRTYIGLVLTFGLVINIALGIVAINAAEDAQKALDQQHTQCVAGNEFRQKDHSTWLYVESFLAPQPRDAETQQKVEEFQSHIDQADKLRDCEKVN